MSLTNNVKLEIIKKNSFKNDVLSLLQGIFVSAGSLVVSGGEIAFNISLDLEELVDFVVKNVTTQFENVELKISKIVGSFKNREKFEISSLYGGEIFLKKIGVISVNDEKLFEISDVCDKAYLKNEQTMKAFLAGMFLGAGKVSIPNSEKRAYGYHFEIDVQTKNQADLISEIFSNFDIFPKVVERGEEYIIYLKNSDTICDAIGLFGANKTVLDLLNKKVDRDVSNLTNRQVNCISANLDRTVNASIKQVAAIETIQNTIGLENLPDNLCETALLRLTNQEASLNDLLELMDEKISKGALAQRFKKLMKIADELGDKNE